MKFSRKRIDGENIGFSDMDFIEQSMVVITLLACLVIFVGLIYIVRLIVGPNLD